MAQSVSHHQAPYVVSTPRATDAIGCALRHAYVDDRLPVDMVKLLRQLGGDMYTRD